MRRTASSMRACGISPLFTLAMVLAMKAFQSSTYGTITMSMPALMACGQSALVHGRVESLLVALTWPRPFQSETTKPSKPILVFSTSVSRYLWPCILSARAVSPFDASFQLLNEAITDCAPACSAV